MEEKQAKKRLTDAEKARRYREKYPERAKASWKKYYDKNRERMAARQRKYQLADKYGITEQDYDDMFKSQEGKCAICKTENQTGKWQRFGVDHCHKTGKVRALLCNECNRGIGLLKDDPEILKSAVAYLEYHKLITKKENDERI